MGAKPPPIGVSLAGGLPAFPSAHSPRAPSLAGTSKSLVRKYGWWAGGLAVALLSLGSVWALLPRPPAAPAGPGAAPSGESSDAVYGRDPMLDDNVYDCFLKNCIPPFRGNPTLKQLRDIFERAGYRGADRLGFLDLFVGSETTRSRLYHNKGDGTFEEAAPQGGHRQLAALLQGSELVRLRRRRLPRSLRLQHGRPPTACSTTTATATWTCSCRWGGATPGDRFRDVLFQNPGGHGNHWLTVKLVGRKTNRPAVGARIKVTPAGAGTVDLPPRYERQQLRRQPPGADHRYRQGRPDRHPGGVLADQPHHAGLP